MRHQLNISIPIKTFLAAFHCTYSPPLLLVQCLTYTAQKKDAQPAITELPQNPSGCIRTEPVRRLSPKEKERYLDAFTLNPINSFLPPPAVPKRKIQRLPTHSNGTELRKSGRGIRKFRKSLAADSDNYERMKILNATGQRLQVLRSSIQGWGVYAKQNIKYVLSSKHGITL